MRKYLKYIMIFGIVDFALLILYEAYRCYMGKSAILDIIPPSEMFILLVVGYTIMKKEKML